MAMLTLLSFVLCAGLLGSTEAVLRSNGDPVSIEDFASVVQIDFRSVGSGLWGQSCAGSILNSLFILSAANCFHGIFYAPENRRIRAGSEDRNSGGYYAYVQREYNHPTYGRNGNDGDVSVVRLLSPLSFNDRVRQGVIIAQGTEFFGGLPIIHVGWGASNQAGVGSEKLTRSNIFTIDRSFCRERYDGLSIPEPVTENMLCVGFLGPVDEGSVCLADFGGPMYYPDSQYGNILIALTSFGHGCSDASFPGVATAVSSYTNWIVSTAV